MQQAGLSRAPRRSEGTIKRIVRTGNITNSVVVIGDNNRLSINSEGNAIIDRLASSQRPKIKRRSSPIIVGRPTHSISLLDRDLEKNTVHDALQPGNSIEFYCEEGLGKTTLVRYLSSQAQMADGMVFIDRGKSLDDLLQELFEAFYHSDQIYRPTQVEYKRRFENIRALILLDNYALTRVETQVLLDTLPNCVLVLASNERHLWEQGNVIHLSGLPLNAAMTLFQQRIGRELTQREVSVAQSICESLHGHPLHIIQAAALVHDEGKSLQEVTRQIQGTDPQERILESALAHLPKGAKSLLALLSTFRNAPLPAEHLAGILQNTQLAPLLKFLLNRGLVKAHSPSYSLTGSTGLYLNGAWDLSQWNDTALRHFVSWTSNPVSIEQTLDSAEALMVTMENAAIANRWEEVLQIGVAIEPSFVIGRRWGFWERLLGLLTRAGRALGERAIEAWILHQLGSRALCLGNFQEAKALLSHALEIRRAIGDHSGASATQHNLNLIGGGPPPNSKGNPPSGRGWMIPVIGVLIVATLLMIDMFGNGKERQVPIPIPVPVQVNTSTSTPTKAYSPEKDILSNTPSLTPSRTITPSQTPSRTVTPSSTPTPSYTFTPTFTPSLTLSPTIPPPSSPSFTFTQNANCRKGPGTAYEQVTSFNQGQMVQIVGRNESDPRWWLVLIPNYSNWQCWVSYVTGTTSGPIDQVGIVAAPPLPPSAPSLLFLITDPYDCTVKVSWTDVSGEDGYRIYRDGSLLVELPADTTFYTDTGDSYSHSYYVQAYNAAGSANSDEGSSCCDC